MDTREGFFGLDAERAKTGRARHVYFNGAVKKILERLNKARHVTQNFVFTYRGKPLRSIKGCLATALGKAKIRDFRFHDLRHTYVTNARKAGVDRVVIMKLTGHKTLSMFTRYSSVDEADGREAVQRMDSFFGKVGPSAAIVLQEEKRGREKSPNPLIPVAPRVGLEPTT